MTPKELIKAKIALYDKLVRDPRTRAIDLRVAWLLLFKYLNSKSEIAWPSAETMAEESSVTVRSVRRSITRLTGPKEYFTIVKGGGRGYSNRYAPNFQTVTAVSPIREETVTSESLIKVQTVTSLSVKGDISGPETVTAVSPDTLEESIEKPLERACAARFASPDGDARGATCKTKKVCSAIKAASLENVLHYRRQELESGGRINHAALSNRDRDDADEWLRKHGEVGAEQSTVNGRQHAGSWVCALLAPEK